MISDEIDLTYKMYIILVGRLIIWSGFFFFLGSGGCVGVWNETEGRGDGVYEVLPSYLIMYLFVWLINWLLD